MSSKGKPEFHPDFVSPKRDPLSRTVTDFDMDSIEAPIMDEEDAARQKLAEFVRKIFTWVTAINLDHPNAQAIAGRRFLALAWVLDPVLFDGVSASALAKRLGIKSVNKFQILTGEVAQHFRITNRGQDHAWNRGKAAAQQPTAGNQAADHHKTAKRGFDGVKSILRAHGAESVAKESFPKGSQKEGQKEAQPCSLTEKNCVSHEKLKP